MKQQDIALIIIAIFSSAVVSLIASRLIFATPQNRQQTVERVDVITAEFTEPSRAYFNERAVNPTQQITIGDSVNPSPFNPQSQ